METIERLYIGIDIQEEFSQAAFYDVSKNEPKSLVFGEDSVLKQNPEKLSLWTQAASDEFAGQLCIHLKDIITEAETAAGLTAERICICVERFELEILKIITEAMKKNGYSDDEWILLSYDECFAYYAYSQKRELHSAGVLLLDYTERGIYVALMDKGVRGETEFIMENIELLSGSEIASVYNRTLDFSKIEDVMISSLKSVFKSYGISTVYLTGKGFETGRLPNRLRNFLCAGKKVFAGQNLYVKGACYAAAGVPLNAVPACRNRVTTQIEMDVEERSVQKRIVLVRAGLNWYATRRSLDFIVDDISVVKLILKPCDGSGEYIEEIDIGGIPFRENKMTRININLEFIADGECLVKITDKGFGEFAKSSGMIISKVISLG